MVDLGKKLNIGRILYGACVLLAGAFILGLVSLVGLSIFAKSQEPDVYQRRAWIASSNSAANYPIFGAIVPRVAGSKILLSVAHFLDLRTGNRHILELLDHRFNSITADYEAPGSFLITGQHLGKYFILRNEIEKSRIFRLLESELELRSAFMLDGDVCALNPTARTKKQAYDFRVVCNGVVASEPKIKFFDNIAATGRLAATVSRYADRVFVIQQGTQAGRVDIKMFPLPAGTAMRNDLFVFGSELYLARTNVNSFQLFRITDQSVEHVTGPLLDRLVEIRQVRQDLLFLGSDHAVFVNGDPKARDQSITTWSSESGIHQIRNMKLDSD